MLRRSRVETCVAQVGVRHDERPLFQPCADLRGICRVGQNRISAPYMTVCMVISLLKYRAYTVYTYKYMVLANPRYIRCCADWVSKLRWPEIPWSGLKSSKHGRKFISCAKPVLVQCTSMLISISHISTSTSHISTSHISTSHKPHIHIHKPHIHKPHIHISTSHIATSTSHISTSTSHISTSHISTSHSQSASYAR